MTPCISPVFIEAFFKDRLFELSPHGSKVVDLSAEHFFKLSSAMKWASAKKNETQANAKEIDETLIKRVAEGYADYKKAAASLDKTTPAVAYHENAPVRFALLSLLRLLVKESKQYALKKGDGRDLCHAVLGASYGSLVALDKQWKRRIEALPRPNRLGRVYYAPQLDQMVIDLEGACLGLKKVAHPSREAPHRERR